MTSTGVLPTWVTWQARPFPDANLLLLPGPTPALVDSGFVGHAVQTREWAEAHADRRVEVCVNTHWHSDHVGGPSTATAGPPSSPQPPSRSTPRTRAFFADPHDAFDRLERTCACSLTPDPPWPPSSDASGARRRYWQQVKNTEPTW